MDGETVEAAVSQETPAPVVEETPAVDPIEAKIEAAIAKALAEERKDRDRKIQSEADKRVSPLQRRLREAEARAQAYEGALRTFPSTLGPDADPSLVQNARLAQQNAELGFYRRRDTEAEQAQRIEEAKQQVLEDTREDIAELGVDPDDTRIKYDLNQPDAKSFRKMVMAQVRQIREEDMKKSIPQLVAQEIANQRAKDRKESGVDTHEAAGTAGATDEAFMKEFAEGKRNTPEDFKRAKAQLRKLKGE